MVIQVKTLKALTSQLVSQTDLGEVVKTTVAIILLEISKKGNDSIS